MRAAGIRACVLALAVSVCALPDVGGPPRRETERLKDKGALERRASGEAERADEERRLADCDGYRTVDLPDALTRTVANYVWQRKLLQPAAQQLERVQCDGYERYV